ncbi:beta-galactosidase-1-like protein 2 [Salvelinus namaycush]|uniref:Beta-galactosidase-1-like protein 2 n=1 Tax=Salvelinus namaycush TaxID=8040 RepID=A0A8U1BUH3_SALNM|nr:beta-galactosidase-1-like protein 2 [Salvelinus namaycush]
MSRRVGLSANSSQFTLEGETFRILGGSVHYFRVPRAYWRDRLMKMKACGINTLTTYVPWSLHQPERGVFHFQTELDLEAYINLAAEVGLWVILRPGPYICSELDLGGLPSWLLRDGSMRLRTTHPGFAEAVNTFFDKLIPKVVPLQFKKGGPIIAVQLENEYGSFAMDNTYMPFIKEALQSRGINELLLTSDNHEGLKEGGVTGVIRTVNLQKLNQGDIKYLNAIQPNSPMMVMEYWTGWFDAWGDLHHVLAQEDMVSAVREILRRGMSINLYMFHGGTNFGFMSGALTNPIYKALITSYDYDAPLSESGEYTPKYHLLRDLFSQYHSEKLPDMPALRWKETYEPAIMYQHLSLWDALTFAEEPFKSPTPVNMENLPVNSGNGQSYGYTLYETIITSGGSLKSGDNVRDRALEKRTLSLLVENCGRVHYGKALDKQRKGLIGDILLNNTPLRDFTIYSLDMKTSFIDSFPGFFLGRMFTYGYPSDTFVKLPGWGKGVVFINGLNLGRHWYIGPQQTLYLPGPFLNSGVNQVIVFEEQEADYKITFEETPDLGMAVDIQ